MVPGGTTFPPAEPVGLWMLSSVPHDTMGKHREVLFCPLNRAEVRRSRIGGGHDSGPFPTTVI